MIKLLTQAEKNKFRKLVGRDQSVISIFNKALADLKIQKQEYQKERKQNVYRIL